MKIHELAKYFPLLEGDEFVLLVQDIKENGQLEPIVLFDGKILDGVNRWRACKELGIECESEEYKGDDPLSYVISLNIRRRHLDPSQRAMLATEMLPEFIKEGKRRQSEGGGSVRRSQPDTYRSRDEAAKQFGVSGQSVQRAKRIKEQAPDKVEDIIKGKTSVRAIDEELRIAKRKQDAKAKRRKTSSDDSWRTTPDVVHIIDWIQRYQEYLAKWKETEKAGKLSPEAGRFIAKRSKGFAQKLISWAEYLERKYYA